MITCSNSSAVAFPVRCSVMGPEPSRADPNRSTTSASVRVAATGSLAPATAEITATPAAPASSTSAAFEAAIPPIPTTGMRRRPHHVREPFRAVRHRLRLRRRGPDRDAQIVRAGALRRHRLVHAADAHAQDATRPQVPARGRVVGVLTQVHAARAALKRHVEPVVDHEQHPRVPTCRREVGGEREEHVVIQLGGPQLHRGGAAHDRRARDGAVIASGTERSRRDDVDPERSWIEHRPTPSAGINRFRSCGSPARAAGLSARCPRAPRWFARSIGRAGSLRRRRAPWRRRAPGGTSSSRSP